ncbi:MAG: cation:proton antiporter subunit C [Verrucomicrobiota bacterium]
MDAIFSHINFYIYVILMMIGMWAMIAKNNLIKKLIGMSIFQTAIILFFVSLGVKDEATIPITEYVKEPAAAEHTGNPYPSDEKKEEKKDYKKRNTEPNYYANPLPHVLMLTAIVVGVATLGVALAISQHVFHDYETLEEDEILDKIRNG